MLTLEEQLKLWAKKNGVKPLVDDNAKKYVVQYQERKKKVQRNKVRAKEFQKPLVP